MNNRKYKTLIRKSHRYLGVFIGIQFLFWTISGLFFSWTNIKEIRGDHLRGDRSAIKSIDGVITPADVRAELVKIEPKSKVTSFRIVNVLDTNYFEVIYTDRNRTKSIVLFDTKSGKRRNAITKEDA